MKLPIPIIRDGKVYNEINIIRPKSGVIADTRRLVDEGDNYIAIATFIAGCTESVISSDGTEITDKSAIRNLIRHLPFRSAELIAINIILLVDPDDGIEGIYTCPRCGNKVISGVVENNGEVEIDTRDFIKNLPVNYMDGQNNEIVIDFDEPIVVGNKNDPIDIINSIGLNYPTLIQCSNAYKKFGGHDQLRLQFAIYVEAITKVNGNDVDSRWKNMIGMPMFETMSNPDDVKKIGIAMNEYGIKPVVKKTCTKCGKIWEVNVSTSNFFVSGLQQ